MDISSRLEKPGLAQPAQGAAFRADIEACEGPADQAYKSALARRAKLSQIYGQAITPETVLVLKRAEVQNCLAGSKDTGGAGRGWIVK